MAANQAKDLSDKNIIVIPTKNVSQAFAALVNFDADLTIEENEANMVEALSTVKSGQVTYAVRNTVINDVEVKEGNIIGLGEGKLLSAGDNIDEITTNHNVQEYLTLANCLDEVSREYMYSLMRTLGCSSARPRCRSSIRSSTRSTRPRRPSPNPSCSTT